MSNTNKKSNNHDLDVQNVSVFYGRKKGIADASLIVKSGQTYGLIGLNGAGKTTLIKSILDLRKCDSGLINIAGRPSTHKNARQNVAYLPEKFEPPWFLTGREFVKFTLNMYRRAASDEDIKSHAEKFDLDPNVLKNRVKTYSKGMKQKLGLMATIMSGAQMIILDEPMSGLDPRARARVKDMILSCRREGRTVILSSHILADMNEICDMVSVIHQGAVIYTGTPAELIQHAGKKTLERAFLTLVE